MTPKTALISGVTGQDGSYLSELLLSKGYSVHGIARRASVPNSARVDHLLHDAELKERFALHYGDLADANSLRRLIDQVQPDEVYNLGAQSHVKVSFDQPEYTVDVTAQARCAFSRRSAPPAAGASRPLLPGRLERDVRLRQAAPERTDALRAAPPVRLRKGLCPLAGGQLPRELPPVRLQRHPLQPREPAAR